MVHPDFRQNTREKAFRKFSSATPTGSFGRLKGMSSGGGSRKRPVYLTTGPATSKFRNLIRKSGASDTTPTVTEDLRTSTSSK